VRRERGSGKVGFVGSAEDSERTVGLVLAGGGARGAYEMGALSALLPALAERGERPRVVVGTSVGALNATFVAATAERPVKEVVERGRAIWSGIRYEQVLRPLASPSSLRRLVRYAAQFLGVPHARVASLLDPAPLRATLRELIPIEQIECNVADGALDAAAVVATSALTSRSVVFHRGGQPPAHDDKRGIDYVAARLTDEHVRASSAIPGAFPAVHVAFPQRAAGWYFDGGTRLNTPIKPALALGAQRVVVVALNAIPTAPPRLAGAHRPDAFEGAAQLIQAVMVDPLAHDTATLASYNGLVGDSGESRDGKESIPYIFVAPREADAIGRCAQRVFEERYRDLAGTLRSCDLAVLGRAVGGGLDPAHGELLSYLFFAPELAEELMRLGRADACRWLAEPHVDGPWETGPLHVARAD
jgi:NTE family protein